MKTIILSLFVYSLWIYTPASAETFVDNFEDGVANG